MKMAPLKLQQQQSPLSSSSPAATAPLIVQVSSLDDPPPPPPGPSPYRRGRFDQQTRRETMERRKYYGKNKSSSPSNKLQQQQDSYGYRELYDDEEKKSCESNHEACDDGTSTATTDSVLSTRRQPQHLMEPPTLHRTMSPEDDDNFQDVTTSSTCISQSNSRDDSVKYYGVVYRGVVALLSQPNPTAPRSGCYLSYGEVIASRYQIPLDDTTTDGTGATRFAIRVDEVLTGGYAFDPPNSHTNSDANAATDSETPKKSNVQGYPSTTNTSSTIYATNNNPDLPITSPVMVAISRSHSSCSTSSEASDDDDEPIIPLSPSTTEAILRSFSGSGGACSSAEGQDPVNDDCNAVSHLGFCFSHNNNQSNNMKVIMQQLESKPQCQHGRFFYKIVSTTPLPILSAPSTDAPLSKAMVLPGTVHEVSFRIFITNSDDSDNDANGVEDNGESNNKGIWFLRLARRKGYIANRRIGNNGAVSHRQYRNHLPSPVVMDITNEMLATGKASIEARSPSMSTVSADDDGRIPNKAAINSNSSNASANVSVLSLLSTALPATRAARNPNRRHRPPRRRGDGANDYRHHGISAVTARSRMQHHGTSNYSQNSSSIHDTSTLANLSIPPQSPNRMQTPSSNVSLLSDEDSMDHNNQYTSFSSVPDHHDNNHSNQVINPRFVNVNNVSNVQSAVSPDRSVARSVKSHQHQQPQYPTYFLMRVTAPRGLRILDAPHFQVNNLIHGTQESASFTASSTLPTNNMIQATGATAMDIPALSALNSTKNNQHHLFHTMAGRITTTSGITPADNAMIFDSVSKTRILPRGGVFEASKRMETSDAALFHHQGGAGLIKLADNSGWVIVPHREELEHQYRTFHGGVGANGMKEGEATNRGYEEIGNAIVFPRYSNDLANRKSSSSDVWMRVVSRVGAHVVCAPPAPAFHDDDENNQSRNSSPSSSANNTSGAHQDQLGLGKSDSASDVTSSVGSSFLDAMFRAPKRSEASDHKEEHYKKDQKGSSKPPFTSTTIPCGVCVQVEPQIPSEHRNPPQEYARIKGGQGWLPLFVAGRPTCVVCPRRNPPSSRFGSFWFRVQSKRGIKVRLGPSKRAPSIKSNDGVYFRFECGEFLRASELMTVYHEDNNGRTLSESFAKLYRNRHVRLAATGGDGHSDFRHLPSLTAQAEWVQIHDDENNEQFLHECSTGPRIERHRQGWRYKIVTRSGMHVKKGPSFDSEDTGMHVPDGESVVIIERVTSPDENGVTWLRMKEGQGWLHDIGSESLEPLVIPHSFRHRTKAANSRPTKPRRPPSQHGETQQIAYNTIIARLFHNELPGEHDSRASPRSQTDDSSGS